MAWTSGAINAAETTARAADHPCLVAANVLTPLQGATPPRWSSDSGLLTDTDRSATGYEAYYGIDHSAYRVTRPSGSDNEWWYTARATNAANAFDCWGLTAHNLTSIGSVQVRLDIADSADFVTNYVLVDSASITSGSRHLYFLGSRYSGGGYVRLRIWNNGGANFIPEVGEFWVARTRQLRGDVLDGGDLSAWAGEVELSGDGTAGAIARQRFGGAADFDLRLLVNDKGAILDSDQLESWWSETNFGRAPFLFCPRPNSAQQTHYLVRSEDTTFAFERASSNSQILNVKWREQPQYFTED